MAKTQKQDIKDLTQQELLEKVQESQVKYKKAAKPKSCRFIIFYTCLVTVHIQKFNPHDL